MPIPSIPSLNSQKNPAKADSQHREFQSEQLHFYTCEQLETGLERERLSNFIYQQSHWSYLEAVSICDLKNPLILMMPHTSVRTQLLKQHLKVGVCV